MPIHAYRLVYRASPQAPEMLWEWEEPYIQMLIENARVFHREVVQRYFLTWEALAQENQRIWETYYLPRSLYTYCISSNNSAIVLSYQWLPASIQRGEAIAGGEKRRDGWAAHPMEW